MLIIPRPHRSSATLCSPLVTKKRGSERKKERLTIYASLCGGGDLLKAPGSVAHYLADDIFYSTNDISIEKRIFSKPLLFALPSGTIVLCNRLAARESDFTFDTVIVAPTHISSIQISCSIPFM